MMISRNHISVLLIVIICWNFVFTQTKDCPPPETILPCRCAQKENELQIWCSHSNLPQVLEGIRSVARTIKRPIDELILENNQLPALPGRFFSSMLVTRLMLRHNNLERLSNGWLNDLEDNLVEIFIVEQELRSVPVESLNGFNKLEAITIHSDTLKRPPDFTGLLNLKYLSIQSAELLELQPQFFKHLPKLETIKINGGRNLNRLDAGLFDNLPSLNTIDISRNSINWIHLRALYRLPRLLSLKLTSNQLTDVGMIGRAVKDLENLQKLRLDKNFISMLNEGSFVDLPMLKELHLNDNRITEIHYGSFHRTPNLRVIYLQNNLIKRIHPESFLQSSGSGVEILYVQNNEIDRVEELRSLLDALPTLKFLDMSYNYLVEIPFGALRGHGTIEQLHLNHNLIHVIDRDALMAMPGLRELRLRNNSISDSLATPFWNLPGLKGLDLSMNKFRKIDSLLLAGIPSLRRLDMSQNYITSLDTLSFLHVPMLETLNVSFNEISFIHPAAFRNLDRLFEIDASSNQLQDMIIGLPTVIERVSVRNNRITNIPLSNSKSLNLPNLRMLDMSYNNLEYIPNQTFQSLKQLRVLSLTRNRLRAIEDNTFSGTHRLEMLHIQDNEISDLQDHSLDSMSNLRDFNLQGNKLEVLNDKVFMNTSSIEQLDLSRNSLRELSPMIFKNLKSLKYLDLSGNILPEIPSSLSLLSKLRDIDISSNRLVYLPPAILSTWKNVMEIRLSNNQIIELKQATMRNLPRLQYLDLSSNELNSIERGALRNLPDLQELVLADNKLVELKDHVFEELPSLQAAHLQHNLLRYVSPQSFYKSPSLVYLNLSSNQFRNMENIGLRNMRNLEVLDLSSNDVQTISTMPLQALNWLVELKLDNNRICKVQGEPFAAMPRLRVLSMRNNRMKIMSERTFRNLRGNIAILDIDGNPIACICEMLWLSVWLDETNSPNPGPRCQNGKFLRAARFDKSECNELRNANQIPLINEHGDIFVRQLNGFDEDCERNYPDDLKQRPSPGDSEYFLDQYIDYPFNETQLKIPNATTTIKDTSVKTNQGNKIDLNNTVLNYNLYNRPRPTQSSSPFTFFGYPIPTLNMGKFFGRGRNSDARSSTPPSRGRVRMYRPNEHEIEKYLDEETQFHDITSRNQLSTLSSGEVPVNEENQTFRTPFRKPIIEQGGFNPILPETIGGFIPINDPYQSENSEKVDNNSQSQENSENIDLGQEKHFVSMIPILDEFPRSTTPTDFARSTIPNPHISDNEYNNIVDIRISTFPNDIEKHHVEGSYDTSSFASVETLSTENYLKGTDVTDNSQITTDAVDSTFDITSTPETILLIPPSNEQEENSRRKYDKFWDNINHSPSSLSALVSPGVQQSKPRSAVGRPTITKVLAPNLPAAEEFFRTTSEITQDNDVQSNDFATSTTQTEELLKKEGMDWYYENYRKSGVNSNLPSNSEFEVGAANTSNTNLFIKFILIFTINFISNRYILI